MGTFESEINFIKDNKNTFKENFEVKLNEAYDEIEQLKNKLHTTEALHQD
jgi:hypothetical protein